MLSEGWVPYGGPKPSALSGGLRRGAAPESADALSTPQKMSVSFLVNVPTGGSTFGWGSIPCGKTILGFDWPGKREPIGVSKL